jgi:alpha-tubulin suppressor-like RCC1 family protein
LSWPYRTFALTKEGEVYSWGKNNNGELGYPCVPEYGGLVLTPKLVTALTGKKICAISDGYSFALGLTKDGKIYSWGSNRSCELGRPPQETISDPEEIPGFPYAIISVAAGTKHAVAIDKKGKLWMWGDNFTSGPDSSGKNPIKIKIPEKIKFTSIACGATFTGALSEDGVLYMWGSTMCRSMDLQRLTATPKPLLLPGHPEKKLVLLHVDISLSCARPQMEIFLCMGKTGRDNLGWETRSVFPNLCSSTSN